MVGSFSSILSMLENLAILRYLYTSVHYVENLHFHSQLHVHMFVHMCDLKNGGYLV